MTSQAVTLKAPQQHTIPVVSALRKAASNVWQAMQQSGERRAERELARFASLYASQFPELGRFAQKQR